MYKLRISYRNLRIKTQPVMYVWFLVFANSVDCNFRQVPRF